MTSEIKSNMINYVHKLLTCPKYPVSVFTKSTSVYTMLYIYIYCKNIRLSLSYKQEINS